MVEKHIRFPECRHRLFESDRVDLRARLIELWYGPDTTGGLLWAAELPAYRQPIAEVEANAEIKPDKETRARIRVIKKCLAILDERRESGIVDSATDTGLPFPQRTFHYPGEWSESSTIPSYPLTQEPEVTERETPGTAHPSRPVTAAPEALAAGPFAPLLLNYSLADLTALLKELGLLDPDTGKATLAATAGAWVGVVYGLVEAERPRLLNNKAAIRRALKEAFSARIGESTLQAGVSKRGSESEKFRDRTLALLATAARDCKGLQGL